MQLDRASETDALPVGELLTRIITGLETMAAEQQKAVDGVRNARDSLVEIDGTQRESRILLARILDLQSQLDQRRQPAARPSSPSRPSVWDTGLAFLRGGRQPSQKDEKVLTAAYWDEGTVFRKLFDRLDHADIIQFGSGSGEHAASLYRLYHPRRLTLVDGSTANLEACKARFTGLENISYVLETDPSIDRIEDGSQSAAFSYDHLVHLEYDDVAACLMRIGRVVAPGKHALLHHSANDEQPGIAAADSRGGRSFMSLPLFRHLCARAGLFVVESTRAGEFDQLSLVQRISPLS
jgi:SAM-dependent methyltransferase